MAKKKSVNKSQAIRDYAKANGKASPKEIAEALASQGIKGVSPQYVSTILSKDRSNGRSKMRVSAKKRGAKKPGRRKATSSTVGLESVEAAADFISTVGGLGKAKQALSAAEEIAKKLR